MAQVSQKAPKAAKTTQGNVEPTIHCECLVSLNRGIRDKDRKTYLADRAHDHEQTTEEEVRADRGGAVGGAHIAPAHQVIGERCQGEQETQEAALTELLALKDLSG